MMSFKLWPLCLAMILIASVVCADVQIESEMVHLRISGAPEWSTFPDTPDANELKRTFSAKRNTQPIFLRLRHQDVKQTWNIELNGKTIGTLKIDENDMIEVFAVPVGAIVDGDNELKIFQAPKGRQVVDDIRVGEVVLGDKNAADRLSESKVEIHVVDEQTGTPLPSRITITNSSGALQSVGAESNDHLAVRPGIVYTSTGSAEFGLPAGNYSISAGRGFEYSLATTKIQTVVDGRVSTTLKIRREVPTEGYVACDTHVHTLTHSGHGDASVDERMITLAAEGIELPIATDHNVQIDHRPFAAKMNVGQHFTSVIGNEVTTKIGHFNVWPIAKSAAVPNHKLNEWGAIADELFRPAESRIAILNHARDVHGGTTPFGPKLHNSVSGTNLDQWPIRFNAMEVVNSGATQTDIMQLFHDWMGLLNAGYQITPVGCSDSHDVGRHFVGQARTYIRCDDHEPGSINVTRAADAFLRGEVMVSYGLLCEMTIDDKHQSGAFVQPSSKSVNVNVRVLGPHWTKAREVLLFANGRQIHSIDLANETSKISDGDRPATANGIHADVNWLFDLPEHDVHIVAIAVGPGIDGLHWKTAKPYQPDSPDWTARTIGCSGVIWIDADKDGRRTPAIDYARRIVKDAGYDLTAVINALTEYDAAVSAQAASLLQTYGVDVIAQDTQAVLREAEPTVRDGFLIFQEQWRANQIARIRQ